MSSPKIFCIGFQKTGTSSLGRALDDLGYSVCGAVGLNEPELDDTRVDEITRRHLPQFDAFQDNPWPILYRELDKRYPGSKFILTVRDTESWLRSASRHFGTTHHPMQQWIYGVGYPVGNEQIFIERYESHNREVVDYFRDRSGDLLVLDLTTDGWPELSRFLGKPVREGVFPHANKGSWAAKKGRWARRFLERNLNKVARVFSS